MIKVYFISRCTWDISQLFEVISWYFCIILFLFKRYGWALTLIWISWNSEKRKYRKNEEENFEFLNRGFSKNESYIIRILVSWDAQKCMVCWEKSHNYWDNGGQSCIKVLSATGVMFTFINREIINTTAIKMLCSFTTIIKCRNNKVNIQWIYA